MVVYWLALYLPAELRGIWNTIQECQVSDFFPPQTQRLKCVTFFVGVKHYENEEWSELFVPLLVEGERDFIPFAYPGFLFSCFLNFALNRLKTCFSQQTVLGSKALI